MDKRHRWCFKEETYVVKAILEAPKIYFIPRRIYKMSLFHVIFMYTYNMDIYMYVSFQILLTFKMPFLQMHPSKPINFRKYGHK
jgi:hypothetical protein